MEGSAGVELEVVIWLPDGVSPFRRAASLCLAFSMPAKKPMAAVLLCCCAAREGGRGRGPADERKYDLWVAEDFFFHCSTALIERLNRSSFEAQTHTAFYAELVLRQKVTPKVPTRPAQRRPRRARTACTRARRARK